jgi:hypothetical protein
VHELFATAGDIRVSDSELNITLAALGSPHRTRAPQALCMILDQTATILPGSRLRIRFAMRPPRCIAFAFAGFPLERSISADGAPAPRSTPKPDILALPYVRQPETGIGVQVLASFDRSNHVDIDQACVAGSLLY